MATAIKIRCKEVYEVDENGNIARYETSGEAINRCRGTLIGNTIREAFGDDFLPSDYEDRQRIMDMFKFHWQKIASIIAEMENVEIKIV